MYVIIINYIILLVNEKSAIRHSFSYKEKFLFENILELYYIVSTYFCKWKRVPHRYSVHKGLKKIFTSWSTFIKKVRKTVQKSRI